MSNGSLQKCICGVAVPVVSCLIAVLAMPSWAYAQQGACCRAGWPCEVTDESRCEQGGGTYMGDGSNCNPDPCVTGACCNQTTFACFDGDTLADCNNRGPGFTFLGGGTVCANDCVSGACCIVPGEGQPPGCFGAYTPWDCATAFGTFVPGGTCTATEACCLAVGGCQDMDPICCLADGGVPQGSGVLCISNPCGAPTRACCLPSGVCQTETLGDCQALNGTWGNTAADQCTTPEACCFESSGCLDLDPLCCTDLQGYPQGQGSICGTPVACCDDATNACSLKTEVCCIWAGPGFTAMPGELSCQPNPCGCDCPGDVDGNGIVDFDDVDDMVTELLSDTPNDCANVNGDLFVNGLDIQPFVELVLANGGLGTPCYTGACCDAATGVCTDTLPAACQAPDDFRGVGTICDPVPPCPLPPTGACCFESAPCQVLTHLECTNQEGNYEGDETDCGQFGSCVEPGSCTDGVWETCCEASGGTFQLGQCMEACCDTETGACSDVPLGTCAGAGGGPNSACDGGAVQACCYGADLCIEADLFCCAQLGGTPQGPGSECTPDPCTQGACCTGTSCSEGSIADCVGLGGTFQGAETTCTPQLCAAPTGGCCLANGVCQIATQLSCTTDLSGTYRGDGAPCGGPPEACCLGAGVCIDADPLCCGDMGGTAQGFGTACSDIPDPCPQEGNCCTGPGTCQILTEALCLAIPGIYQGDGTGGDCVGGSSTACMSGVCCHRNGTCYSAMGSCQNEDEVFLGWGSTCATDCPTLGSCCVGTTCHYATEYTCAVLAGTWMGSGIWCFNFPCDPTLGACCVDYGEGGVCEWPVSQVTCLTGYPGATTTWYGAGSTCPPSCP